MMGTIPKHNNNLFVCGWIGWVGDGRKKKNGWWVMDPRGW